MSKKLLLKYYSPPHNDKQVSASRRSSTMVGNLYHSRTCCVLSLSILKHLLSYCVGLLQLDSKTATLYSRKIILGG